MSKLRNLLILGCMLGFSIAAYGGNEQKTDIVAAAPVEKVQLSEKVNINTAKIEELRKVKGIGKKISEAIVDYRAKNGKFKSVNDLMNMKCRGINKNWFDKVSSHLEV